MKCIRSVYFTSWTCVCLSVTVEYSCEMAERIEMPFGMEVGLGPIGAGSKGSHRQGQIGEKKERKVKLAGVIERIRLFSKRK